MHTHMYVAQPSWECSRCTTWTTQLSVMLVRHTGKYWSHLSKGRTE